MKKRYYVAVVGSEDGLGPAAWQVIDRDTGGAVVATFHSRILARIRCRELNAK